jgi:hypothetical protein
MIVTRAIGQEAVQIAFLVLQAETIFSSQIVPIVREERFRIATQYRFHQFRSDFPKLLLTLIGGARALRTD